MKTPKQAIRAGVAKTNTMAHNAVRKIDHGTRRNGWFRGSVSLGAFVWAQVELTDWLASSSSALSNSEVIRDALVNGAVAEVGTLALAAVANKVSPNSNPWLRRVAVAATSAPLILAGNVLFRHYVLKQEVLPGPFLDTQMRDLLTLAAPTAAGAIAGSLLVAPRPEGSRPATSQFAPVHA